MQVLSAGTLEQPIDESLRNSIGMKVLRTFDACMRDQLDYGRLKAATALKTAFAGVSAELAKSDILSALKELSSRVRQSGARDMIVFVLSDMLENSSISSFYANHNVRAIDPSVEIKKVEAAQQFGDFGGARVFVLGAGLVQGDGSARRDRGISRPQDHGQAADVLGAVLCPQQCSVGGVWRASAVVSCPLKPHTDANLSFICYSTVIFDSHHAVRLARRCASQEHRQ